MYNTFGSGGGSTPATTQSTSPMTGGGGFLGGFDFNDIIAAAVVWNGYQKSR